MNQRTSPVVTILALRVPEPKFFVLGMKSDGRNSTLTYSSSATSRSMRWSTPTLRLPVERTLSTTGRSMLLDYRVIQA